ncbi:hypothetical protein BN8_01637 [Fibrisoma limi BUZ 3]|uniref:Uncharacterized protein n=1 Tax=Fibrisoma limi BUZ 3 TaxID=1185876 RepID=I2GFE8_9BACT|nr:hypothetical protein BN8_01637 [Fibrisoma limi BUZ 3]
MTCGGFDIPHWTIPLQSIFGLLLRNGFQVDYE